MSESNDDRVWGGCSYKVRSGLIRELVEVGVNVLFAHAGTRKNHRHAEQASKLQEGRLERIDGEI